MSVTFVTHERTGGTERGANGLSGEPGARAEAPGWGALEGGAQITGSIMMFEF